MNVSTLARVTISKDIEARGPIIEIRNNRELKTTWFQMGEHDWWKRDRKQLTKINK